MIRYIAAEHQTNTLMRSSASKVLEEYCVIEPPVNVYEILKREDVQVDFWPFPGDLDGLYLKDFTGPGMAINFVHPRMKQRFTAAHELKHHLHDIPGNGRILPYCKSDDKRKIERRANAFAADLLMPSPMFRSAFNELHALGEDLVTVTTLAGVFRVSYEATVYRLNTLGYVTDGQKKKLLSPNGRKEDLKKAHQNGSDQRVAKIRTPALLAALGQLDSQIYCLNCSAILLDGRWSICPDCGTECV